MKEGRDVGFKEGMLPEDEVVVPQLRLMNAWFSDMDKFGEPGPAHNLAVLELHAQGYSLDEIEEFCHQRDETLKLWRGEND